MTRFFLLTLMVAMSCNNFIAPIDAHGEPCAVDIDCQGQQRCHAGVCLGLRARCNNDGFRDRGEQCDDGNANDQDACTNTCRVARCGDGIVRMDLMPHQPAYEDCESERVQGVANCSSRCRTHAALPRLITAPTATLWLHSPQELHIWGPDLTVLPIAAQAAGLFVDFESINVAQYYVIEQDYFMRTMRRDRETQVIKDVGYSYFTEPFGIAFAHFEEAGQSWVCTVTTHGDVACRGDNPCGQAVPGGRPLVPNSTFVERGIVRDLPRAIGVAASRQTTCAAAFSGEVWCWGDLDNFGHGANGRCSPRLPTLLEGADDSVAISANANSYAALQMDGRVVHWGWSWDQSQRLQPTFVDLPAPAVEVSSANGTHCARLENGTVACWGKHRGSPQGPGAHAVVLDGVPATATLAFSNNAEHLCLLGTNDSIWCWGNNDQGQLGDGTTNDSLVPVQVVFP